jgi:hypothetical protein
MSDLEAALRDLARMFEAAGIPYAAMGGIAVRVYGIPRPTYDLDFTIALDRDDLGRLYTAAEERGFTIPDQYRSGWVDQVAGMPLVKIRLYVAGSGIDVDLFLAESAFQQSVVARRREEDVDGTPIWLVSPEDLILLKLVANRARDVADVGDVLFMQGTLDVDYLRQWASDLGVLGGLEDALKRAAQS